MGTSIIIIGMIMFFASIVVLNGRYNDPDTQFFKNILSGKSISEAEADLLPQDKAGRILGYSLFILGMITAFIGVLLKEQFHL